MGGWELKSRILFNGWDGKCLQRSLNMTIGGVNDPWSGLGCESPIVVSRRGGGSTISRGLI